MNCDCYDPMSQELAEHFLLGDNLHNDPEAVRRVALAIQKAAEDEIECLLDDIEAVKSDHKRDHPEQETT